MYYQNYEDYMRQVLGYSIDNPNIYETYDYRNGLDYMEGTYYCNNNAPVINYEESELKSCYPEIYKVIYPIICQKCDGNAKPFTTELVEQMTDEIYDMVEPTTVVNVKVEMQKTETNRNNNSSSNSDRSKTAKNKEENRAVNMQEDRRHNSTLRDLIKILILNRILGNRPIHPRPPRPPFPRRTE